MNYNVQIIAPSSGLSDGDNKVQELAELLRAQGLKVKPPVGLFAENMHYYANTVEKRFEQMREALLDPEVDIIWAFRGGYGASEIAIQCMDIKPSHRKILIGYSDITVLHELFQGYYKMPSIHGSCGVAFPEGEKKHLNDIIDILGGKYSKFKLKSMTKVAETFCSKSVVTGGNLTLVTTMIGTKLHPNTTGKIILFEEVGEKGYRIARLLNHCSQAGLFDEVEAIIFGDLTKSDEHLDFALEDFSIRNHHIPIFKVEGIGHGDTNIPIILGYDAEIENGLLKVYSPFGK